MLIAWSRCSILSLCAIGKRNRVSAATAVLITGASGFVGSAVARTLLQAGFPVRALVRQASPRFHLDGLDLEFVSLKRLITPDSIKVADRRRNW